MIGPSALSAALARLRPFATQQADKKIEVTNKR